jgi:hypothetical protein
MDDDAFPIRKDWLRRFLRQMDKPETGVVGIPRFRPKDLSETYVHPAFMLVRTSTFRELGCHFARMSVEGMFNPLGRRWAFDNGEHVTRTMQMAGKRCFITGAAKVRNLSTYCGYVYHQRAVTRTANRLNTVRGLVQHREWNQAFLRLETELMEQGESILSRFKWHNRSVCRFRELIRFLPGDEYATGPPQEGPAPGILRKGADEA